MLSPVVESIFCQLGELVLIAMKERWESPSLMAASLTVLMSILLSGVDTGGVDLFKIFSDLNLDVLVTQIRV